MKKSNLRLYSNIFPWKGRWKEGDGLFVSKIWDDKALAVLKVAERKRELTLTPYQESLYLCTVQCPRLPTGERPWGWVSVGKAACFCRKTNCARIRECRVENEVLSDKEKEVWIGGNQDGLEAFAEQWEKNRRSKTEVRNICNVNLFSVFNEGEYDAVKSDAACPFEPRIASGYPDDEEYD